MKKIYLIRHGETESNRKGIFRGRLDIPLSERGLSQACELNVYFSEIPVETIFSSPLNRAKKTAEITFPHQPVSEEPLLNNLDLGEWSGKSKAVIRENFPDKWEIWTRRPESMKFPGGESLADVYNRAEKFLDNVIQSDSETIAAVSHRSVTKVLIAAAIKLKQDYFWKFHLDNASVSQLYFEPFRGFTLVKTNETSHLNEKFMEWY